MKLTRQNKISSKYADDYEKFEIDDDLEKYDENMYISDYAREAVKRDLSAYDREEFKHKSKELPINKPDYIHDKDLRKIINIVIKSTKYTDTEKKDLKLNYEDDEYVKRIMDILKGETRAAKIETNYIRMK